MTEAAPARPGPIRALVAWVGSGFILGLIRIFGRLVAAEDVPWLVGPVGGPHIGDRPYEECARREGLVMRRDDESAGLLDDFETLRSPAFDPGRVDPRVRHFYEHTATYRIDLWARTWFPANVALWLLVTTISRKVDQLNFPLDALEAARGMDSEIVTLRESSGRLRYSGWYRRSVATGRSIYTGFYTTAVAPVAGRPCVKVVFPMPDGSATVVLTPSVNERGDLELSSTGHEFGDAGFYRLQRRDDRHLRVWRVNTLREHFRVFVDADGTLRCDHRIRFLGMPVLHLHYRMEPKPGGRA